MKNIINIKDVLGVGFKDDLQNVLMSKASILKDFNYFFIFLIFILFPIQAKVSDKKLKESKELYRYSYIDRRHTSSETFKHIAAVYGVTLVSYPLFQPSTVINDGSFEKYRNNFGHIVFDKDEPFWNWFVHPISGSQLYLYYRANGYSETSATALAFASSALFEFTVEVYTEPASAQDLYQTPILGSLLGYGLENLSMYFLNSGNSTAKFFGHILNPSTLFWFFEGKVKIIPQTNFRSSSSLKIIAEF